MKRLTEPGLSDLPIGLLEEQPLNILQVRVTFKALSLHHLDFDRFIEKPVGQFGFFTILIGLASVQADNAFSEMYFPWRDIEIHGDEKIQEGTFELSVDVFVEVTNDQFKWDHFTEHLDIHVVATITEASV